jgi:hypothetical protein
MGFETHTWKCKFCGKLHIWNKKYKYCNCCDYKPNVKPMNEENKAIELIEKFYNIENDSQYFGINWKIAKQCSIIAIEEVQEFITKYDNHLKDYNYLENVKQKILNL